MPLLQLTFMHKYKRLQPGQLPRQHLSFLQNLLSFIITKYLKQEVNDNLCDCADESNPCCLFLSGDIEIYQCHVCDQKVMMLLIPMEKCPMDFYQGVVFTAQIS